MLLELAVLGVKFVIIKMGQKNCVCMERRKDQRDDKAVQRAYGSQFAFTVTWQRSSQSLRDFASNFDQKDAKMKKSMHRAWQGLSRLKTKGYQVITPDELDFARRNSQQTHRSNTTGADTVEAEERELADLSIETPKD